MSGTSSAENVPTSTPRTPRPNRVLAATFDRVTVVRTVLIVIAVLCLAAAFGPVWVVRAGLLLALLAGAGAAWFVSQLVASHRRAHVHELREVRRDHRAAFTAERTHNAEVVDELTRRITGAQDQVRAQDQQLGELGATVADLRTDKKSLARALIGRDDTIAALNQTLAGKTAEAAVLEAMVARLETTVGRLEDELVTEIAAREAASATTEVAAEVHGLPRRRTFEDQEQATAAS